MIPVAAVIARRTTIVPVFSREASFIMACSKLVSGPQLPVINIAARRGVLQELAGVEDSIVSLEVRMPVDLPADFGARPVPDEPGATSVGRNEKKARHSIYTVGYGFPP